MANYKLYCISFHLTDPFFPLMFLINSTLLGMMDAIFQVSFLSTLLIFWLSIYHGLRQVTRPTFSFTFCNYCQLSITKILYVNFINTKRINDHNLLLKRLKGDSWHFTFRNLYWWDLFGYLQWFWHHGKNLIQPKIQLTAIKLRLKNLMYVSQ